MVIASTVKIIAEKYNPVRTCPKCGLENASTKYCAGASSVKRVPGCEVEGEHLHRLCARCGYEWIEYALDKVISYETK